MHSRMQRPADANDTDFETIWAQIIKQHDQNLQRLQEWIHQPSIAAENREVSQGCDLTMRLLRDAGFQKVTKMPTDGQPGIFATLDAGAPKTLGLYFMYDVKQVDPAEWSSPPWEARLVDKPRSNVRSKFFSVTGRSSRGRLTQTKCIAQDGKRFGYDSECTSRV